MRRAATALCAGALLVVSCAGSDSIPTTTRDATTGEQSRATTTVETGEDRTSVTTTTTDAAVPALAGGAVLIAEDQWAPTLNPYAPDGDNVVVTTIGQAHLAGAYDIDAATRELIPELVVELPTVNNGGVVINDDGTMSVSWVIRDDAVWSDSVPIGGNDFVFTLEYRSAMDSCWPDDAELRPEPFEVGGTIESVAAKTITIRFEEAGFQHEELFPWVVPEHAVRGSDYCNDWNDRMWPAAGPFVVSEVASDQYVRLTRNQNYWKVDPEAGDRLPYLDEVEFRYIPESGEMIRRFGEGDVDVIQPPPFHETAAALQAIEGVEVQILQGPVWEHINFQFGPNNRNSDSLNQSRSFRQAVAHALDRDLLVAESYSGMLPESIDGFLGTLVPAASSQPWSVYDYDPERASALVEAACEEVERDCATDVPTVVFSTTSDGDVAVRLAEQLPEMLAKAGISVEVQLEESQLFFGDTLDLGTWDVGFWAWVGGSGASPLVSQFRFFDPDAPPPDGDNVYRWGTPGSPLSDDDAVATFRTVLSELRATSDYAEVTRLAGVLELILAEEVAIIPLSSQPTMGAFWADQIAGFEMNPTRAGYTWNIESWHRIDL